MTAAPLSSPHRGAAAPWSTTANADPSHTAPMALALLGDHVQQCRTPRGAWVLLRHAAVATHGFVASRFVTTLALAAVLLIGAATLLG